MFSNLQPNIQNIKSLSHKWSKQNKSLLGMIHLIKMIMLLKVNYITYMLPLTLFAQLIKNVIKVLNQLYGKG